MKAAILFLTSVCVTFGMSGCSDSSSGGSSGDPDADVTDEFGIPGGGGEVEEVNGGGTDPDLTFEGRRFYVEGGAVSANPDAGLQQAGESAAIDEEALVADNRPFITIPHITTNDGRDELAPYGVFYSTESDFRFALTFGAAGNDVTRTIATVDEEGSNAGSSCIGPIAFDPQQPNQTALPYAFLRNDDGNCVAPENPENQQWYSLRIGQEASTPPAEFALGWLPRAGLPASGDKAPSWLVLDLSEGGELALKRIFADDTSTAIPVTDGSGGAIKLAALFPVAELGPDSFLVAKRKKADDEKANAEKPLRLAHFDAQKNTLKALTAPSDQMDGLPGVPQPDWVSVRNGTAYIALDNEVLSVNPQGISVIDGIENTKLDGVNVDVDVRPIFLIASDTHVLWGLRIEPDGGRPFRQVWVIDPSTPAGGVPFSAAGFLDGQIRGHANGWMYFTAADSIEQNGRLNNPRAVGINPEIGLAFFLQNAHWIGSSLAPQDTASFSNPATANINGLFFRAGDDLTRIAALIDPTQPLEERTMDGEQRITLPAVTVGTLDSGFTAVSIGPGFGPDRLITAFRSADDGASSRQVFRMDPRDKQVGMDDESGEDPQVRALSLF